jgi:hypothetical protein
MKGKLHHIQRRAYPKKVPMLHGAPAILVGLRFERGQHVTCGKAYETNRDIKYWSTWFLLKALTTTSYIQHWISQKKYLLSWLQMNENTFRRHIAWLKNEGLLQLEKDTYSLRLCTFERAAEKLELDFEGVYHIEGYLPGKYKAPQPFQYLIRTEEFEYHKARQTDALMRKIDDNPSLKNDLVYLITQMGADYRRLQTDPSYFAYRMLKLQTKMFQEGSDIFQHIMQLRADVNRGARLIKSHHNYRSAQSVAYMKRKMAQAGLARVWKVFVESKERTRFRIPAQEHTPAGRVREGMQDGYKYVPGRKLTLWRLTDQVARVYDTDQNKHLSNSKTARYAA